MISPPCKRIEQKKHKLVLCEIADCSADRPQLVDECEGECVHHPHSRRRRVRKQNGGHLSASGGDGRCVSEEGANGNDRLIPRQKRKNAAHQAKAFRNRHGLNKKRIVRFLWRWIRGNAHCSSNVTNEFLASLKQRLPVCLREAQHFLVEIFNVDESLIRALNRPHQSAAARNFTHVIVGSRRIRIMNLVIARDLNHLARIANGRHWNFSECILKHWTLPSWLRSSMLGNHDAQVVTFVLTILFQHIRLIVKVLHSRVVRVQLRQLNANDKVLVTPRHETRLPAKRRLMQRRRLEIGRRLLNGHLVHRVHRGRHHSIRPHIGRNVTHGPAIR
eukprot:Opistho-2@60637